MSISLIYVFIGRQFDKHGNLKQWWNNRTIAEFRGAAQCIIEQYNNYTLEPYGLQIDGRLTQGENIADNGGLKQAYRVIIHLHHTRNIDYIYHFHIHEQNFNCLLNRFGLGIQKMGG